MKKQELNGFCIFHKKIPSHSWIKKLLTKAWSICCYKFENHTPTISITYNYNAISIDSLSSKTKTVK